jgi:two-component system, NarL family, invasion response regulator UvrY
MPKILIVDDHPVVREGIGRVLTSALPQVILGDAEGATDARARLRKEPWDLVILDLTLGSDDGIHELQWMRESYPAVPVLIVSMHPREVFANRTAQEGAAGYVSKDSPPQELARAVGCVLAGEKYQPAADDAELDASRRLPHQHLSDREYQVLRMIGQGRTVSEIAAELSLSVKTVSTYRSRILDKMEMRTSAELMRYAIAHRLVPWQAPTRGR